MPVENLQQLLSWNPGPQQFVIDSGILVPETIMVIFGAPGSWKSITAIHTAFTIAEGSDWLSHHTAKSSTFVYQVEMPRTVQWRRISKYSCALQNCNHSNLFFETNMGNQIDNSYGFASLEKSVNEVRARSPNSHLVLFLDPMSKLMGGSAADELDTKKFINNLDTLRIRYGVTIVIVHHERKVKIDMSTGQPIDLGSEDMFGGELNKWCDTAIKTKLLNPFSGSNKVRFSFVKTRHAEGYISDLEVEWNRSTLTPSVTREFTAKPDEPSEPTVRDLR